MPTYTLIASSIVGAGGSSSVTFSAIPQTYTDLVIHTSVRSSSINVVNLRINGDTTSQGYNLYMEGDGANAGGSQATNIGFLEQVLVTSSATSTLSNGTIYIPNYTSAAKKSIIADNATEGNVTTQYIDLWTAYWNSTSAITSLEFFGPTFQQYSSFYLYGIKNS